MMRISPRSRSISRLPRNQISHGGDYDRNDSSQLQFSCRRFACDSLHAAVRASGSWPGQAATGCCRRRSGRGDGCTVREQRSRRRGRCHADRTVEKFYNLFLLESLCRRLQGQEIADAQLRQGAQERRERRSCHGRFDRPRQENSDARRRRSRSLRPTGDRTGYRPQMGFGPWLFRSSRADHAARLETGRADRIAGQEAQRAQGRSLDRHGGAAQSIPLPAGPL